MRAGDGEARGSICFFFVERRGGRARTRLAPTPQLTRIPSDQGALHFRDRVQRVQEDLWGGEAA